MSFPQELPISACVQDIARAIHDHQVVVVAGETGSGKTTQLPKLCLAMGRGLRAHIACTQPRRIAATSVAARVAEELGVELGREIGYKIRFSDKTSRDTYVKFVTDGILLAELQGDPELRAYDTIMVDEAHERSLNIDFLLGYLHQLLPRRSDLRVIISSATLETDRFSSFFRDAPVIEVSGRTHAVEVVYHPADQSVDLTDSIVSALDEVTVLDPRGDVLVFLPGEREIQEACDALAARQYRHTVVLPLYGRLPQHEQLRVFQTLPQRRVVLATNVAETSVTIPGIAFVIDSGVARIKRYNPRTGMTQLLVEPISRASADQRKGRAGRVRSGVCYRLYGEDEFASRAPFAVPEVRRVGLAGVILQMKALGLGRIETFAFLDPPSKRSIDDGYHVLEELGALDEEGEPTEVGRKLAALPLDPRLGRMLLSAAGSGCLRELLIITSALSVQDPRERPFAVQRRADESHRRWRDDTSDFVSLLKLWQWYQDARGRMSQSQLRKLCRDNFVSFVRMREWGDIHKQLLERSRELGWKLNDAGATGEVIHRAVLSGLLGRIGMWQPEKRSYLGARQTRFVLHPSSSLAKKPPAWVFAAEVVETSQPFARMAATLDPSWLEELAGPLCKRSYRDPHWEARPADVVVHEQVSLFGLPIVRDRRVPYGPIAPDAARQLFLLHALVRQEYASGGAFFEHNRGVLEEARRLRDRARRSDMMFDEDALLPFFESRLPRDVLSGKTFEAWRAVAESENPAILELSLADVLQGEASDLTPARYPDALALYGTALPLSYRFEPSEEDDGVTVSVPLAILAQADPDVLEWTIPAWHTEKIVLLLHSLPRSIRRDIAPIQELAQELAAAHKPFEGSLYAALERDGHALTGVRIPRDAWRPDALPRHLRFYFRVVDDAGKTLGEGRNLLELKQRLGARARASWAASAQVAWERRGLVAWTFDALPERVAIQVAGGSAYCYPALVDDGTSVSLRALSSRQEAEIATRAGLRRLLLLQVAGGLPELERLISNSLPLTALAAHVATGAKQLREQIAMRALDDTFALNDAASTPRSKRAFVDRWEQGRAGLRPRVTELASLAQEMGGAVTKVEATIRKLNGKPGASRVALADARGQLESMLIKGLFERTPVEQLARIPRYLKGIQVRLERLPNDPRRDADKAAQVVPMWQSFQERGSLLRAKGVPEEELDSFRWLLEELRVCLFAPELKTAVPVSPQRVAEVWKTLSG